MDSADRENPTSAEVTANHQLWREVVEVALLCVLIIGVWSLLSLPIIFYHLPVSEMSPNTSNTTSITDASRCSAPLQYAMAGGTCLTELASILTSSNCPFDPEGNVLVVRNEEATARQLIDGLPVIGASAECISKAVPFLCLHLFGLCGGGSGVSIQPTTSQCEEVRDTLCPREWVLVQTLGFDLPDCAIFPAETSSCPALNDSLSTNGTVMTNMLEKYPSFANGTEVLECTEDFYRENGSSVCTPSCYSWTQHSKQQSIALDVVLFICAFIGFISAIAVIIVSCLRYKIILRFPSILIVYMVVDLLALAFFAMVNYMDRNSLFCSSRSLIESQNVVTPFCIISGFLVTYVFSQLALWWLLHTAAFFWRVLFPFHARAFEMTGKSKYIHIICGIIGVLLPLVPIITSMANFAVDIQNENKNSTSQLRNSLFLSEGLGFGTARFPPVLCIGTNRNAVFYSLVIMTDVILALGCSLLIIIIWSVRRQKYKFNVSKNQNAGQTFGTAEKKLLIVFCYYVVTAVISLTAFTLATRNSVVFVNNIQKYFFCEQRGHDTSNPCSRSNFEKLSTPSLGMLTYILLSLYPVVNLVYVVNIRELKQLWRRRFTKKQNTVSISLSVLSNPSATLKTTG